MPRHRGRSSCGAATLTLPVLLLLAATCEYAEGIDNLRVAYQWKLVDFAWPNEDVRRLFPGYRREDNVPLGLEVAGDKLFVTVPRWRLGVAASLNYIHLNDTRESPELIPYPSWESHQYGAGRIPEVVSTFRIRSDRCGRLWVLDTGLVDILENPEQQAPPTLVVYDLTNDQVLRKHVIPIEQRTPDSLFASIAVEDASCEDTYAYLADLGGPGLVVYSWRLNTSWLVKHHFFHPDPQGGEFNVSGIAFQWREGLYGLALAPMPDGYSTLYFHPLSSTMEFSVSTKFLRNPDHATSPASFHDFTALGSRGPNGQSSVSFLDPERGILFYALTNLNAIACWRAGSRYLIQDQGRVYMDNVTMVFPTDLKIDQKGNIWVLSNRLPTFMYGHVDSNDYNFRILTGSVQEAVRGTVCSLGGLGPLPTPSMPMTSTTTLSVTSRVNIQIGGNQDADVSKAFASSASVHLPSVILSMAAVLAFAYQ